MVDAQPTNATFFAMLSEATKQKLQQFAALLHYQDGQLIHSRGANKPGLSIVKSGIVCASVTDSDGKQIIAALLGKGHCFGEFTLFADLPRTHDISAVGDTYVWQIQQAPFMQLFESEPELSKALLKTALLRIHLLLEINDAMRRLPLLYRTARILLIMSYTTGSQDCIPCKQEDLANTLGVSRVSVGKALKQLGELGWITPGYRSLQLNNRAELANWLAKECADTSL